MLPTKPRRCLLAALALLPFLGMPPVSAQPAPAPAPAPSASGMAAPETTEQRQVREFAEAVAAVRQAAKVGPQTIALIDQGELKLPEGYLFVPQAEAARLMRAMGNRTGPNLIGLVISSTDGLRWFALLTHNKVGYVKDDDAKSWNADELLKQLKEGTESSNSERISRGFPPVEVAGWIAPPAYDAATHRLVWSALLRDKASTSDDQASVNYNTYALGREGFYQLNLISDRKGIDGDRRHAGVLLAALGYNTGKRYEDFQPGSDHVAEYGLAALIAGAAAKKLGLLAVIGAFLVKGWKLIAVGFVLFGGVISRLFRRKNQA